jgi:uncharacterized protein YjbI with pentapeptide repeats
MADAKQVSMLTEVEAWNAWRAKNPAVKIDLQDAVLIGYDLRKADLSGANLTGAHLAGAYLDRCRLASAILCNAKLFRAHMGSADLQGANLEGADLGGAHLGDANLTRANLRGAQLRGANFYNARLDKADLSKAQVGRTIFGNLDLSGIKGLQSVQHVESSTIGLDTFCKSKGKIPESFLEGAGVPSEVRLQLASIFKQKNAKTRR